MSTGTVDTRLYGLWYRVQINDRRPTGCPDLVNNTVVAQVLELGSCPVCGSTYDEYAQINHRCTNCFTYLLWGNEGIGDIVRHRNMNYSGSRVYAPGLEVWWGEESPLPVVIWTPSTTKQVHDPNKELAPY